MENLYCILLHIWVRQLFITVPSLACENNNSPPARTAAADAAIYCIYNAIKIRAYNEHFRVKNDIVVGLTGIYIKKKLCHIDT